MKSIESRTEIFLPLGKTVDVEKARTISEGCEDIIQRMLDLTDQLRRIGVDQYEYVAMKVLVLITPGKVVHSCSNRIGSVMVSVLASSTVDRGFEP